MRGWQGKLGLVCGIGMLVSGCIKSFHETRVGEELWEVGYTDIEQCDKARDENVCIERLKPSVAKRGQELCGDRLQADVKNCKKTQRRGLYAVVCDIKCVETQATAKRTIPIRIAEAEETSYDESTSQLRVIINSKMIKNLFRSKGLAAITKLDKNTYHLMSDKRLVCVKAVTHTSPAGDVTLKSATAETCQ